MPFSTQTPEDTTGFRIVKHVLYDSFALATFYGYYVPPEKNLLIDSLTRLSFIKRSTTTGVQGATPLAIASRVVHHIQKRQLPKVKVPKVKSAEIKNGDPKKCRN
ncbi:hypothetical protein DSO57_1022407 [Entomophthora muscae]|uniref:Uncharacterized protein n=1 Tax=Entomophthora muscae TaxID=34485 RepID=A0ACC2RHQ8_9FUNG|nr:hypothetical protein DSO57_1022407 [Entomophthora muscae]